MTADAVAAPVEATTESRQCEVTTTWRDIAKIGLLGGAVALYLCLVGIVPVFHARPLITGVITLGQVRCSARWRSRARSRHAGRGPPAEHSSPAGRPG